LVIVHFKRHRADDLDLDICCRDYNFKWLLTGFRWRLSCVKNLKNDISFLLYKRRKGGINCLKFAEDHLKLWQDISKSRWSESRFARKIVWKVKYILKQKIFVSYNRKKETIFQTFIVNNFLIKDARHLT